MMRAVRPSAVRAVRPSMTSAARRTARDEGNGRVRAWAALAVLLAVAGVAASVLRPFAPSLASVGTDLDAFDPAVIASVRAYAAPRIPVALLATVLPVVVLLLAVVTAPGRRLVRALAGEAGADGMTPAWRAGLVALGLTLVTSSVGLPLSVWSRLVHDARWEFRTQTSVGWLADWASVHAGRAALVTGAVWAGAAAMRRWPRSWPYRVTVVATGLAALGVMLHPVLLLPATLPTEPLGADAEQRLTIDPVLEAAGEPALPVFVAEESRRSTRVNALATGLGPTARIIVYDNLLELPDDQIASVVAHEVAHHQHHDLLRGVLLVATAGLPASLLVRRVVGREGVQRRVAARGPSDPRLVGVVLLIVAVLELASQPVVNAVSRNLEASADTRALEITGDPTTSIASARTFTVRDLSDPEPPGWVRVVFRTHPGVGERIRLAVAIAERDGLALPTRDTLEEREAAQHHPSIVGP
jgi:STE24 endopeptidase